MFSLRGFFSKPRKITLFRIKTKWTGYKKMKWKWFKGSEVENLKEDLVFKLDRARDLYGHAIVITSGYRTPEHNESVGGKPDSAHVKGKAVDIRSPIDATLREKLAWALGRAGFERVGSYDRHFHCDTDFEKPHPAWWEGKSQ